jgi:putative membrane protein
MEGKENIVEKYSLHFLVIMYSVGVIGHNIESLLPLMQILTPFTLLLTGGVVFYNTLKHSDKRIILWCVGTYFVTFLLEVIGVKTGLIFGGYNYGDVLGFKILDTPLIIGLNWMFIILGVVLLVDKFFENVIVSVFFTGFIAVLFDYILEPVAINLGYWNWDNIEVPFQNYVAWFIIAVLAAVFFKLLKIEVRSPIPVQYFFVQLIFFLILNYSLT